VDRNVWLKRGVVIVFAVPLIFALEYLNAIVFGVTIGLLEFTATVVLPTVCCLFLMWFGYRLFLRSYFRLWRLNRWRNREAWRQMVERSRHGPRE
jgi:amino acid permease